MKTEKELKAIERLKAFEPDDGYYLCYSGGKDSDVIRILSQLAGVKHEVVHNLTTVDAPETVRYVKSVGARIDRATYPDGSPKTMWNLIVKKHMPPTRLVRYCCSELKEAGGKGRAKITDVRWAESNNRKNSAGVVRIIGKPVTVEKKAEELGAEYDKTKFGGLVMNSDNDSARRLVEHCYRTTSTMINPIVDWTDEEVWEFLDYYGCCSNPLYECGYKRIGCIGCPIAGAKGQQKEFALYPKYKQNYIRAFDRMIEAYPNGSRLNWQNGLDVYKWWIGEDPNQINLFDE